jgi:hypothetical protein
VDDACFESSMQAGVDRRRQRSEVLFCFADRGLGGRAVAIAFLRRPGDFLEVALQRPRVRFGDQPGAGAPAGDQQSGAQAQQAGGQQTQQAAHRH